MKYLKSFHLSAGLILLAMAVAHLIGNQGSVVIQSADPVSGISSRYLFWILAGMEFAVAMICLFGKALNFQSLAVFWLTSNLFLYRLGLLYFGVKTMNPYYGTMAHDFGVPVGAVNLLQTLAVVYLWLGSGRSMFLLRRESKQRQSVAQAETDVVSA